MTAIRAIDLALGRLTAERDTHEGHRASGASDAALDWAIDLVTVARDHAGRGDWAAASAAISEVARRAIDSWSLTAPVTDALADCNEQFHNSRDG